MNKKQICDTKGKDFHKLTKRCVKKCNAGEKRNKTFKCMPTKKLCDSKGKDFNRFTLKCIKKCDIDKRRTFYCPTKTKDIHFNPNNLSRRHPCDKSKFGKLTKKDKILYNKLFGKSVYSSYLKKNYGTGCRPKCNSSFATYNKDTKRCREHSWWLKEKRNSKKNENDAQNAN